MPARAWKVGSMELPVTRNGDCVIPTDQKAAEDFTVKSRTGRKNERTEYDVTGGCDVTSNRATGADSPIEYDARRGEAKLLSLGNRTAPGIVFQTGTLSPLPPISVCSAKTFTKSWQLGANQSLMPESGRRLPRAPTRSGLFSRSARDGALDAPRKRPATTWSGRGCGGDRTASRYPLNPVKGRSTCSSAQNGDFTLQLPGGSYAIPCFGSTHAAIRLRAITRD